MMILVAQACGDIGEKVSYGNGHLKKAMLHTYNAIKSVNQATRAHQSTKLHVHRWESGYWKTMDIAHDRAGYYLCWGCLNWVPAVYTSPTLFLATHPQPLSAPAAIAIAVAGVICIYVNYDADRQRQVVLASSPQPDPLPN